MAAHLKKRVYEEFTKVVQVSEESSELCRVIPVSAERAVVAAWGLTQGWLPGKGERWGCLRFGAGYCRPWGRCGGCGGLSSGRERTAGRCRSRG